jgi:outer membrane protein OmpA-like peptidoglycan-associated protein
LLTFIWRLLLLVGGSGIAIIVGMALAQRFATNTPSEPPLIEKWRQQFFQSDPSPQPSSQAPPSPAIETPKITLTSEKRQQLQNQLQQLQQDYNELIGRTSQLEQQLGNTRPLQPLDTRLEVLAKQLNPSQGDDLPPDSPRNIAAESDSLPFGKNVLSISLPSDFLFEKQGVQLKDDASAILDNLLAELRNYPRSTVLVGAYTDNQPQDKALDVTFQQATAIADYLKKELSSQYRWIVLGYGSKMLTVNGETSLSQVKRRIEVKILPYS